MVVRLHPPSSPTVQRVHLCTPTPLKKGEDKDEDEVGLTEVGFRGYKMIDWGLRQMFQFELAH